MGVWQQTLGHGHGQVRDAAFFNQGANVGISLSVGSAFAQHDQRTLGALEQVERALHGVSGRDLARCCVNHLDERTLAGLGFHGLREQLGRQVQVNATRAARQRRADGAGNTHADVLCMQHPECGFAKWLGNGQLVHLFVVTLLQVNNLALAGAADQDHGKAVGGGIGQSGQAVEEARGRHRQADAGLLRQETSGRCGIAGVLLMAEMRVRLKCK